MEVPGIFETTGIMLGGWFFHSQLVHQCLRDCADQLACSCENLKDWPTAAAALNDFQPVAFLKLGQNVLAIIMGRVDKGRSYTFVLAKIGQDQLWLALRCNSESDIRRS